MIAARALLQQGMHAGRDEHAPRSDASSRSETSPERDASSRSEQSAKRDASSRSEQSAKRDAPSRSEAPRGHSTASADGNRARRVAFGAWFVIFAALLVIARGGALPEHPELILGAWLVAGAAWIVAVRFARRVDLGLATIMLGALALRLPILTADTRTSDDVYRYLWEGDLVVERLSPYAHAPNAPELESFRAAHADLFRRVNHPDVSAAYPPVIEATFACARVCARALPANWFQSALERDVFVLRSWFGLCDLATCLPLAWLLARRGLARGALVVWAWSPLAVLEFAGAAHFDAFAIAGLLCALGACGAASRAGAFAASIGSKYLPIVALPFAARDARSLALLFAPLVLVAASFAAFIVWVGDARGLVAGLSEYGFRWEASSLSYRFVEGFFGKFARYDESWSDPRRLARTLVLLLWIAYAIHLWRRRLDAVDATGRAIGAFLVLTPTLHPWYVCWVIPFLAFRQRLSWLALVALVPLAYAPLGGWVARGVWVEPAWLWPALAVPFFALRILESRRESEPTSR